MPRLPARPILRFLAYLLAFSLAGLAYWVRSTYGDVSVDQAIWHLVYAAGSAYVIGQVFFVEFAVDVLLVPTVAAVLAALLHAYLAGHLPGWRRRLLHVTPGALTLGAVVLLGLEFSVFSYAAAYLEPDRFAQEYVHPNGVEMRPVQRRNLVLVYAESLEASYGDPALFGRDLLAPLHELGGHSYAWYRPAAGATWTMAAIVATQCGVPLKVYAQQDLRQRGPGRSFLPGASCLGDVLRKQGYRNVFLGGVSLSFAGKGRFFHDHGYDETWGLDEWERAGADGKDANVWGLWDSVLFERATATLDRLYAAGQPFNLTLLTLDTHNPAGFMSPGCRRRGAQGFDGIVNCSAAQIADLVKHARERGYLRDTTVVVIGDHLAMPNPVTAKLEKAGPRRGMFNLVVGDGLPAPNTTELMPFDFFPTLVELSGIQVEGDRLGLGYSAVGPPEAKPAEERAEEWSLSTVNGSRRYDQLWSAAGAASDD